MMLIYSQYLLKKLHNFVPHEDIWKIAIPLYYNIQETFFSHCSLNGNLMGKPQYKQLLNIKYHLGLYMYF